MMAANVMAADSMIVNDGALIGYHLHCKVEIAFSHDHQYTVAGAPINYSAISAYLRTVW